MFKLELAELSDEISTCIRKTNKTEDGTAGRIEGRRGWTHTFETSTSLLIRGPGERCTSNKSLLSGPERLVGLPAGR